MKEFTYTITDPAGIHARPAGILVKKTQPYASEITLVKGDKQANGKSMLSVMGLGARNGDEITVQAEGADEADAIAELEAFFKENL
ncbi:HPr family phosphocarrier protein [uncultured Pseudoramibacter sp.]|jgi:phosphocarrier protein HPr|uniref:HPr family phosphocarrier protein n=1 Tax=Candidatus Pseudoramibacter fermentans TaxID=2594427 RepID=A0A6L5GQ91_9FIRM|nr:HPr family phosphocarrier protein [uncultured Pseudoramibacter sp.]MQM72411.1 HPr family phosphocarrier protein [Candidatus Pseudoramibacter fermentans]RRF92854.1 MAG: HPr family phosphocarrier protein [Eubacteriaceae bacterium]